MEKSIENYTKEIDNLTEENKKIYSELEEIVTQLIDKSTEMMKKQIKERIEFEVKNNPEHTKKLNDEGKLKEVKEMMNDIINNLEDYVKEELSLSNAFLHRTFKIEKRESVYTYTKNIKENYQEVYRILLGYAGSVICKFEYEKAGNDYNGHSTWKYISGSGGKIKYGCCPETRKIDDEWKNYIHLFEKYVSIMQRIDTLTEEKEKTEATNLWESI